jgi:hypothetical protein
VVAFPHVKLHERHDPARGPIRGGPRSCARWSAAGCARSTSIRPR